MNNFTKIRVLGAGAFGKVYLVKDKRGNLYALKIIKVNNLNDMKIKLKEIKNLATIESKYVISYKDSWFDKNNSSLLILMEYGENGSLEEKIEKNRKSNKKFNEEEIFSILIQMFIVLNHLKKCRIIHRDLKPANIVFDKNNQLKVTDFGIADVIKDNKKFYCGGTYAYMSPEATLNITDIKSDLWSLGCILFELMTLNMPQFYSQKYDINFIKNEIHKIYIKKNYCDNLISILCLLLTVDYRKRPNIEYFLKMPFINQQINTDWNVLNKFKNNYLESIIIPPNINNLNDNLPRKEKKFFDIKEYLNKKKEENPINEQNIIWHNIEREKEIKKRILNEYLSKIKNSNFYFIYKKRLIEQFYKKNLNEFKNFIKQIDSERIFEEKKRKRQMAIMRKEEERNRMKKFFLKKTFTEENKKKQININNLNQNRYNKKNFFFLNKNPIQLMKRKNKK